MCCTSQEKVWVVPCEPCNIYSSAGVEHMTFINCHLGPPSAFYPLSITLSLYGPQRLVQRPECMRPPRNFSCAWEVMYSSNLTQRFTSHSIQALDWLVFPIHILIFELSLLSFQMQSYSLSVVSWSR